MKTFVQLMESSGGRLVRIMAGVSLIAGGLLGVGGAGGVVMAVVGLVAAAGWVIRFLHVRAALRAIAERGA